MRHQLQRRRPCPRGHHRLHVAGVAPVLLAVARVHGIVHVLVGVNEFDVALHAASGDVAGVLALRSAKPLAVRPAPRPHVELVTGTHNPDRGLVPQRAVRPPGSDVQLLGGADAVKLVSGPDRGHGLTSTLIDSRSAIARYPSGTPSRPTVRSNTRPGSILPSRMSGSSSSM